MFVIMVKQHLTILKEARKEITENKINNASDLLYPILIEGESLHNELTEIKRRNNKLEKDERQNTKTPAQINTERSIINRAFLALIDEISEHIPKDDSPVVPIPWYGGGRIAFAIGGLLLGLAPFLWNISSVKPDCKHLEFKIAEIDKEKDNLELRVFTLEKTIVDTLEDARTRHQIKFDSLKKEINNRDTTINNLNRELISTQNRGDNHTSSSNNYEEEYKNYKEEHRNCRREHRNCEGEKAELETDREKWKELYNDLKSKYTPPIPKNLPNYFVTIRGTTDAIRSIGQKLKRILESKNIHIKLLPLRNLPSDFNKIGYQRGNKEAEKFASYVFDLIKFQNYIKGIEGNEAFEVIYYLPHEVEE